MIPKPKYDPRLSLEQVRLLYAQSYIASMGVIITSLVTGAMLWGYVPSINLILWMSAAIAVTMARHGVTVYFHKKNVSEKEAGLWKNRFILMLILSGFVWGSAGVIIFPETSLPHQVFLLLVLGGMVAGGIGTFSVVFGAFIAYAYPTLLPIAVKLFFMNDTIHSVIALMVPVYLMVVSMTAYHLYLQTRTSLNLRFENLDLIDRLEREKQKTNTVNRNLSREISERKQAQAALQKHKATLESRVFEQTAAIQQANRELIKEIEERKRALKALEASEEKYRLLVEKTNEAVCILQDEKIRFHNKRAETLWGYPEAELTAIPYLDHFHADDRSGVANLHQTALSGMSREVLERSHSFRAFHRDGRLKWVRINFVPVAWENRPAVLCFTQDITQQKRFEQQLLQSQKMEAIGTLASGIAHDFNNILAAIAGNISLVLMKTDPAHPFYKRLRDIESYIESGTGLTQRLLNVAKPKPYQPEPTDMDALLNETVNLFCRTRTNLRLHTDYGNSKKIANVDPNQIRQVIINLLVNAWQAMPDGGDLYVSTETKNAGGIDAETPATPPGRQIKITITDTGIGMPADVLPKIFDPFFTTKKKGRGTGLGLASAYGIIKNHGGRITVESSPGRGSAFHITLPASTKQILTQKPLTEGIVKGEETLLFVDDEPNILEIGEEMLRMLGYTVITARNGEEAIRRYSENRKVIHLIILDMIMPEMTGEQLFYRLREMDPQVKVLLSSGYVQNSQAEKIIQKGAKGFIQKPFGISQLSRAVRRILDAPQHQ